MNAMEILMKQLGIDPEKIQQQVTEFQTLFQSMQNSLVAIDRRLDRLESGLLPPVAPETENVNGNGTHTGSQSG